MVSANESAFPSMSNANIGPLVAAGGLSKRELIALVLLQKVFSEGDNPEKTAEKVVVMTDALLAKLREEMA